jgi:phospholipase C
MNVGNDFIRSVIAAVQAGPQASSTAVLVTWDDCGCFYDHVAPPAGLGIRVPLLIYSPWAKKGFVDHQRAQFSSILAFIEHNYGLPSLTSLNPMAQDGRMANDLMGDFDFTQSAAAIQQRLKALRNLPPAQPLPLAERKWLEAHPHTLKGDDT